MQSSVDDPVLAVLLELGAVVSELFEARDLLRAETPYAALRKQFNSLKAKWHGGGAQVGSTEASQANGAGAETAEDVALVRLRIRFCQDILITNQMAESKSHATDREQRRPPAPANPQPSSHLNQLTSV